MTARRFRDLAGRDAYELIGVADTASRAEIRSAYRRQMLRTHPDHGGKEDQAKLINCALDILMSARADYDDHRRRLARRIPAQHAQQQSPTAGTSEPDRAGTNDGAPGEWADEWTAADEGDPWADAEAGVGEPGARGGAPGAAERPDHEHPGHEHPEPEFPDLEDIIEDDDRPYRPFDPDRPQQAEARSAGGLLNTPMVVGVMMFVLVLIAVIANAGNESRPPYEVGRSVTLPSAYRSLYPANPNSNPDLYPYRNLNPNRYLNPTTSYPYPYSSTSSVLPGTVNRLLPSIPAPGNAYVRSLSKMVLLGSPDHRCTRSSAGRVRCSGDNDQGQLGVGDRKAHSGARPLKGGHTWRAVTVGASHSCAIRQDRSLWCWGADDYGQLGTGKGKQDSTIPRQVRGGYSWRSVAARADVTCAVRTTGSLWCWGSPLLKGADLPSSQVPDRYGLGNTWTKVRVQGSKVCAQRPRHQDTCLKM